MVVSGARIFHVCCRTDTRTAMIIRTYRHHCDIWREGNAKHCRCQRHTRCRIEQIRSGWTKCLAPARPDAPPKHRQLQEKPSSPANNTRVRALYLHHINYRQVNEGLIWRHTLNGHMNEREEMQGKIHGFQHYVEHSSIFA